jgi:probable H4MPT-linked C1 transfer pathway protein
MPQSVLALDIGGANIKAAHSQGLVFHQPFELWKQPDGLGRQLQAIIGRVPKLDLLAVTMTGELCDCFGTSREGVLTILAAVISATRSLPLLVWTKSSGLVEPETAMALPNEVAAANWLALAHLGTQFLPGGTGLVVDMGSTTTDIVPVIRGKPAFSAKDDSERLCVSELLYMGVRRTPLCALIGQQGAAEFFATTLDAYLILELVPENPVDLLTADGRPATRKAAHNRLARMLCGDASTVSVSRTRQLAEKVQQEQFGLIRKAVSTVATRMSQPPKGIVMAGSGEFLLRQALAGGSASNGLVVVPLSEKLGGDVSSAACAYALMQIAMTESAGALR